MNPYINIWFKTQTTTDQILTRKERFNFIIPLMLVSASNMLDIFNVQSDLVYRIIGFIFGTALGIFVLGFLLPWLLLKIGRLWKGQGEMKSMQKVIGLAQIPYLLIVIVQIIPLLFGEMPTPDNISYALQFIVWVFSIRILIIGVARVQKFNHSLALLNILMMFIPVLIVVLFMRY